MGACPFTDGERSNTEESTVFGTSLTRESRQAFLTAMEKAHGPHLRRYLAARMRHAQADVSDLVQEVFLRLLRVPDHETIRNPQAYLTTIASHVLHQYSLRKAVHSVEVHAIDLSAELESAPVIDPETQLAFEQRFERVGRALLALSPKAYVALVLARRDGAPLSEIGARLGVSHSMAKKYLAKALTYCRERLDELE